MTLEDYQNGQVLEIDKPLEWTSFQVVNKIRWHLRKNFNIKNMVDGYEKTYKKVIKQAWKKEYAR